MSCLASASRGPWLTRPVGELWRSFLGHALPPDVPVRCQRHVGENAVLLESHHRAVVALERSSRGHAEEPRLRVDRVQSAVLPDIQPRDVVSDAPHRPARNGWHKHREIRLSARAGETSAHIVLLPLRRNEPQNEAVLGQPPFLSSQIGCDAEGVALLAKQGVAAVATAIRPHRRFFGEVADVAILRVARPRHVSLAGFKGSADRVKTRQERRGVGQSIQYICAHASHDAHVGDNVRRVGDLHTQLREVGAERPHAERNHVHRATFHAPVE
mmetsp:Transcript_33935/g.73142  ORF Transcript_33935/g.73142 Transcript_33935/m.73142 type:complete len:271 (+) Transcript_33935:1080-1892(+)